MNKEKGFSLLESLLALFIISWVVIMTLTFCFEQWRTLRARQTESIDLHDRWTFYQCWAHDMARWNHKKISLTPHAPTCLVIKTCQEDVGWELREGKIMRSWGRYDYNSHTWKTRKTECLLTHVHSLSWKHTEYTITSVFECSLTHHATPTQLTVLSRRMVHAAS